MILTRTFLSFNFFVGVTKPDPPLDSSSSINSGAPTPRKGTKRSASSEASDDETEQPAAKATAVEEEDQEEDIDMDDL